MARTAVGFCLGALLLSVFLLSTLTGLGMNTLVTFYQLCHFVHQPPVTFTPSRPRETRRCAATPRSRAVPGTHIVSLVSFESIVANCQDVPYPYYSPVPLSNTTCILRLRTFPCTVPDGLVCGLCSSTVTPCQRNISYCNRSPTTRTRGTNTTFRPHANSRSCNISTFISPVSFLPFPCIPYYSGIILHSPIGFPSLGENFQFSKQSRICLLYTSPSPRD